MLPKRTRLKTFDYLGQYRYFLTFCVDARRHLFMTAQVVELVLQQILRAAAENGFAIIAYCFMPDHLHLLVGGTAPDSDLQMFCKQAKQYAGFEFKQGYGEKLWQPSFYDTVLRDEEGTWSVARYIVNNPLRAGLAGRADEYPFLGSCVVGKTELLEFVAAAPDWNRS
jgi:putative transposase